jgi:hypothetical protein
MGFKSAPKSPLEKLQDLHGRAWVKQSELVAKLMRLESSVAARPDAIKSSVISIYTDEYKILAKEMENLVYSIEQHKKNWNDGF